jgi:hypothetical protein
MNEARAGQLADFEAQESGDVNDAHARFSLSIWCCFPAGVHDRLCSRWCHLVVAVGQHDFGQGTGGGCRSRR